MATEPLKSYLEGSFNVNYVDQVRRTLAAEGPQIIIPTLRMTLSVLQFWGRDLALIFMKPSDWPFKPSTEDWEYEVYKTKQALELDAGEAIDGIYYRVRDLVAEIASSSSQYGTMVGEQMLLALTAKDEDLRVLATMQSMADGVALHIVSGLLVRLFLHDDDPLTRKGAALAVLGLPDMSHSILSEAGKQAMGFLEDMSLKTFPELVLRVRRNFRYEGEVYQNWMIATLAVWRILACRLFDKANGRRVNASWDFAQFPSTR